MVNTLLDQLLDEAADKGATSLDEPTGKRILESLGVAVPRSVVATSISELGQLAAGLRAPFVLKVISHEVLHKSDLGGVRLRLQTSELAPAATEIHERLTSAGISIDGWLIEEMASPGVEVVVGGSYDPEFGPLVMLGLGGIFVEVLKDVAFRICPITPRDAQDMIDELKGRDLLYGARGQEAANTDALIDVLMKVGGVSGLLMQAGERVQGLDLNPVIVSPLAAVAVDARFILKDGGEHVV